MPTLAHKAELALRSTGLHPQKAQQAVDTVIKTITEPDVEMISAGVTELNTALGKPGKNDRAYRTQLTATIWRAMVARTRR